MKKFCWTFLLSKYSLRAKYDEEKLSYILSASFIFFVFGVKLYLAKFSGISLAEIVSNRRVDYFGPICG